MKQGKVASMEHVTAPRKRRDRYSPDGEASGASPRGLHGFVTNAARTALNASRDPDRQTGDLISRAEMRRSPWGIPIGLNSEGKMVYERTQEKLNDAWFGSGTLAKKIPRPS